MNHLRMRFPGGLAKAFTMSYDDGVEQDLRLIQIMRENGVKGTFNLNSGLYAPEGTVYPAGQVHRRMTEKQCLAAYVGNDLEVAVHASTHAFLEAVPTATAMMEVISDRAKLEKDFGRIVRGMAYPYGTLSDDVVDILRLAGIAYSRTTVTRLNFDIPSDWLRLGATCHHNNPALNELAEKFTGDTPNREPWLFYLWGHAYEFEGNDNWHVIEQFLKTVGHRDDVWYATNIEIHDYVQAFRELRFSVDGTLAQNPTATDVWALRDGMVVRIPAGATIRL